MQPPESERPTRASAPHSDPSAHSSARPNAGSFCAQCDANIFNVSADGMCSSCGTPVILSDFVRGPLTALPRATLKTMESGARLVGTATLLWAGGIVLLCTAAIRRTADAFQATGAEVFVPAALLAFVAACLMLMGFRSTVALPDGLPRLRRDARRRDLQLIVKLGIGLCLGSPIAVVGVVFVNDEIGSGAFADILCVLAASLVVAQLLTLSLAATGWFRLSESFGIRVGSMATMSRDWIRRGTGVLISLPLLLAAAAWVAFGPETSPSVRVSNAWVNASSAIAAICHAPALLLLARTAIRLRHLLADARRHAPEFVDYPGRPVPDRWREPRFFGLGPAKPQAHEPDACAICDYDLAGLAPDAPCPECSTSAALAHARPRMLATEPSTLRVARTGFLLLGWGWLGMGAISIFHAISETFFWSWNAPEWIWWLRSAGVTILGITASLGLWRAALVIPASRDLSVRALHISARLCAIIAIPALTIGWSAMFADAMPSLDALTGVLRHLYAIWAVWFWIAMPLVCRRAARRAEARKLYRWSSWAALIAILWIGSVYGVLYALIAVGVVGSTPWTWQLWSLSGWIVNPLSFITGLIALRLARHLRHAATAAAALREPTPPAPPAP